jgi:shikimate kinase
MKSNITLIGMTGSGKTTLGKKLAKFLSYKFIDPDETIIKNHGYLQDIINKKGENSFLKIEERVILDLKKIKNSIISPGGSVIYLKKAMDFLQKQSIIVFLNVDLEHIKKRINIEKRGIIGLKNKTIEEIFKERFELCKKYADIIINTLEYKTEKEIIKEIYNKIKGPQNKVKYKKSRTNY